MLPRCSALRVDRYSADVAKHVRALLFSLSDAPFTFLFLFSFPLSFPTLLFLSFVSILTAFENTFVNAACIKGGAGRDREANFVDFSAFE